MAVFHRPAITEATMNKLVLAAAVAAAMMAMTATLFAAEQPRRSEPIYGYRLMSEQERNDYRERMRNARSAEERQAIRDEHRKLMQARAKERGVTLPEPRGPRAGGPGAGPGARTGPGRGPGEAAGKGPGYRRGPRADCPAGQECPGAGANRGAGPRR
jgi:hypothetical protein